MWCLQQSFGHNLNYENQKHHEKNGTLTATYFLNKILGEYFINYFIFCVLKGE
jgi:hypothetical protein